MRSGRNNLTPLGFEPTHLALVELDCTPLGHSGKVSCCSRGSTGKCRRGAPASRCMWLPLFALLGCSYGKCFRGRRCRVERTGSRSTSEAKRRRARLVLGWGAAREDLRVLPAFWECAIWTLQWSRRFSWLKAMGANFSLIQWVAPSWLEKLAGLDPYLLIPQPSTWHPTRPCVLQTFTGTCGLVAVTPA